MSITRTLIFNDVHIPFHDPRLITLEAGGLVLDIAKDIGVERILINGDLLDMYNISRYGKSPEVATTLEDELIAGREFIENLRKRFPDTHIVFLLGNHCDRMNTFISENAKVFWNIFSIEKYLDLERHNIEWYPYNYKYQLEKTSCFVQHSPPSYGVNGARTSLLKKLDQTYIYGCTHREQKACITAGSGRVHAAYFNGWLGSTTASPEHSRVFSYAKGHQDWQQAFTVVTIQDEVEFFINQYSIRDHKVCIEGYLYEG